MPISRSPSNCRCSLWFPYECGGGSVLRRSRLRTMRTLPPPHSYGNQRLQRQFDGLLMMGIVMPERCWAVSVRQINKFYDWLLHLVGCFICVIQVFTWRDLWIKLSRFFVKVIHARLHFSETKEMTSKEMERFRVYIKKYCWMNLILVRISQIWHLPLSWIDTSVSALPSSPLPKQFTSQKSNNAVQKLGSYWAIRHVFETLIILKKRSLWTENTV